MKKLIILLLAAVMLTALLSACKKEPEPPQVPEARAIDMDYVVVYEDKPAAHTAAATLCSGIRSKVGGVLKIESSSNFSGDLGTGKFIFVGETNILADLPVLEAPYEIALRVEGLCIRAKDEENLKLAVENVIKAWGSSEEYGLKDGMLWIDTEIAQKLNHYVEEPEETPVDPTLTIMSQNVLINGPGFEKPYYRIMYLNGLIQKYDPDLVGFQEVSYAWLGQLKNSFGDEYGFVGNSRDGVNFTTGEWAPVIYRKSRFELLDSGCFWLSDTPNEPSAFEGAYVARTCSWVKLRDKNTGEVLVFGNTHLDHLTHSVRLQQIAVLMDFFDDYVEECAVYIAGDFNTTISKIPLPGNMESTRNDGVLNTSTVTNTYHGGANDTGSEIDFIFYNKLFSTPTEYHICTEKFDTSGKEDANGYHVSDHYAVLGKFLPK